MKQTRDKRRGTLLLGIAWLGLVMTAPLSAQQSVTLKGHTDAVWSVAFSADGKRIVSGGRDQTVRVWDAQTGVEPRSLKGHTDWVNSVAFSPDGKRIASGSGGGLNKVGEVKVWDAQTGQLEHSLKGHTRGVS